MDFNTEKTQLVSFDWSDNHGAFNMKMDRALFEQKPSFRMLGLSFSSKFNWASSIFCIVKPNFMKITVLIRSMKFLSSEVKFISMNLPIDLAWNTVVMSGLVPLATT